jgi:hypothetical protein
MSLNYDLTGFVGAGSQLNWSAQPQPAAPTTSGLTRQRQQVAGSRYQGHALAASHLQTHHGIGQHSHAAGHKPAHPKKRVVHIRSQPFGEKSF